ncbi:hypothetical protein F2981_11345 [Sinorhizobium meliloti]|nr:hypothetical protein [Sinorhizobium meliloti]
MGWPDEFPQLVLALLREDSPETVRSRSSRFLAASGCGRPLPSCRMSALKPTSRSPAPPVKEPMVRLGLS